MHPQSAESHIYVIYVPYARGEEAVEQLKKTVLLPGEDAYVLTVEKDIKENGEYQLKKRDAFPGYVFLETADPDSLNERLVLTGKGRVNPVFLLKNDQRPIPLYPKEEEFIRLAANNDHVIEKSFGFKEGDKVIVVEGPLKYFTGVLTRTVRHHRTATIKIQFLGEEREIPLGLELLSNKKDVMERLLVEKKKKENEKRQEVQETG